MPKAILTEMLESLQGLSKHAVLAETLAGLGLLGAGVGIPYAYQRGQQKALEEERLKRLMAFGSGALTGYVAPKLLNKLTEKGFGVTDSGLPDLSQLQDLPGMSDIPELSELSSEYI